VLVVAALLLALPCGIARAAEPLRIPLLAKAPVVDGRLAPGEWDGALRVSGFARHDPDEGPARYPTTAWIGLAKDALFVAFDASKPPADVRRDLNLRDEIKDDELAVIVDPYRTGRYAFFFGSDANGAQDDSLMIGSSFDLSWDGIWDSAGGLTPGGFVVEMRIPLKTIRYRGSGEQVWRLQLTRWDPVHGDWETWPPSHRAAGPTMLQAADVVLDVPPAQPERAVVPHVVGDRLETRGEPTDNTAEVGLDALLGLGPSLTARATLNPDFSQVEVDQPQQDRNQRFPLFYPEKRPFFTAGSEIWDSPIPAFYSRRIVNPDWGLKLDGRSGETALVLVAARDAADPAQPGSVDATDMALKVNQELGRGSHVGATVLAQDRRGASNLVGGLDAVLQPSSTVQVILQGLGSRDRDAGATLDGGAYNLSAAYDDGTYRANLGVFGTSPEFVDRLGFIERTDYRGLDGGVGRTWWVRGEHLVAVEADASGLYGTDFHDHLTDREIAGSFGLVYRQGASGTFTVARRVEAVSGVRHDLTVAELDGQVPSTRRLTATFSLSGGDGVNYQRNLDGTFADLKVGGRYNASRHLLFDFSLERYRFRGSPDGDLDATAVWLRSYWFFSNVSALRLLLQRYAASTIRYGELLYMLVIRPGTAAYVGVATDRLPSSGELDRRFFAKLSYRLDF
jgi:Domain of unknown function (DUF5916)